MSSPVESKKRTIKACDRCRLKKIRCDGQVPCLRCSHSDQVCHFGGPRNDESKNVSAAHAVQLQANNNILVSALRAMWERYAEPSRQADDPCITSVHDIVKFLGILQHQYGALQAGSNRLPFEDFDFSKYDRKHSSQVGGGDMIIDSPVTTVDSDAFDGVDHVHSNLSTKAPNRPYLPDLLIPSPPDFGKQDTTRPYTPDLSFPSPPSLVSDSTAQSSFGEQEPMSGSHVDMIWSPLENSSRRSSSKLQRRNRPTKKVPMPQPYQDELSAQYMEQPSMFAAPAQETMSSWEMPCVDYSEAAPDILPNINDWPQDLSSYLIGY